MFKLDIELSVMGIKVEFHVDDFAKWDFLQEKQDRSKY